LNFSISQGCFALKSSCSPFFLGKLFSKLAFLSNNESTFSVSSSASQDVKLMKYVGASKE
jgi:hypothetical protein